MQASPEVLGDPKRETSEEMEERYHRMLSQVLKGMDSLIKTADGATKDGHSSTFLQGVKSVIATPDFQASCLESSDSNVRRDSYDLIIAYSLSKHRAKDLDDLMHRSVFRCLKDTEPGNVASLFAMMIAYGRSFQSSWASVDFETDFAAPVFRILSSSSYSNYIFDVCKSMMPLISVVPAPLLTDGFVSSMIKALWNTHGTLGHNPKLCCAARQALRVRLRVILHQCHWDVDMSDGISCKACRNVSCSQMLAWGLYYDQSLRRGSFCWKHLERL